MLRFASLGSGSEGNGLLIEVGNTRLLLDCGFNLGDTLLRLARLEVEPESLTAIAVTHEHGDHIGGVARLAARFDIPVYLTPGTRYAASTLLAKVPTVCEIDSHRAFSVEDIEVHPYTVPHDAREPVQYVFSDGALKLGVLTDVGETTAHIETMLSGCDALFFESNHDTGMLARGNYPLRLKSRIAGRYGHLSNDAAAAILARLDTGKTQHICAAHLSKQNNLPELAQAAFAQALGANINDIAVADQTVGLAWREVR